MSIKEAIQVLRDQCGDKENKGKLIVNEMVSVNDLDDSDLSAMDYFARSHGALGIKLKDGEIIFEASKELKQI